MKEHDWPAQRADLNLNQHEPHVQPSHTVTTPLAAECRMLNTRYGQSSNTRGQQNPSITVNTTNTWLMNLMNAMVYSCLWKHKAVLYQETFFMSFQSVHIAAGTEDEWWSLGRVRLMHMLQNNIYFLNVLIFFLLQHVPLFAWHTLGVNKRPNLLTAGCSFSLLFIVALMINLGNEFKKKKIQV